MAQIRQELNINDRLNFANFSSVLGVIQIDTTQYNGTVTYYFELVGKNTGGSDVTFTLRRVGTSTDDASITIPANTTNFTRFRSTSFTPPAGQTNYAVNGSGGLAGPLNTSRVVIIQNASPITSTETQIEIGNLETTTATVDTELASPKYWLYTSANWNGTITAYFEATILSDSTKVTMTATLQVDNGAFASWTNVTGSAITTTATTSTRVRSGAITLTAGRNYRVVLKSGSSKNTMSIRNAKIIIDQTNSPTRMELQYLLLCAKSTSTGLQSCQTLFDSTEWNNVLNTYYHAQDAIGSTANARLKDTSNGNAILTNSSITGANQVISSPISDMPTAADNLDTDIVTVGTEIDASHILVQVAPLWSVPFVNQPTPANFPDVISV